MIDGLIKWSALISYWSNEKDSELTKCFLCVTDDFIQEANLSSMGKSGVKSNVQQRFKAEL